MDCFFLVGGLSGRPLGPVLFAKYRGFIFLERENIRHDSRRVQFMALRLGAFATGGVWFRLPVHETSTYIGA
jgi:hypothetical protein